jgi:nucleoside-diphosphate-sugar epimerase
MRAIVTGAGGFVGSALCAALGSDWRGLRLGTPDWERALGEAPLEDATVYHLAARVHDPRAGDEAMFRHDNAEKTWRLTEAAARRGARRIVFLSTLKVHGEESSGRPLRADDATAPQDAYARSKLEGEAALREAASGRIEWVVVRSPLVLGAGARANVASLMRLVDTPFPLPFAAIANRRSFVHRDDLARLLLACGSRPAAANQVFIAAHADPLSTPALVAALRVALQRPERLWPAPPQLLEICAGAIGMGAAMRRLTRSLEADPTPTHDRLGWRAERGLGTATAEMAHAWREASR